MSVLKICIFEFGKSLPSFFFNDISFFKLISIKTKLALISNNAIACWAPKSPAAPVTKQYLSFKSKEIYFFII